MLSREACLLENFDANQPPFTGSGYLPDDLQGESDILKKVFEWVAPPDCTYVDGLLEGAKLQFIADKADGTRVLLCGWFDGRKAGDSRKARLCLPEQKSESRTLSIR